MSGKPNILRAAVETYNPGDPTSDAAHRSAVLHDVLATCHPVNGSGHVQRCNFHGPCQLQLTGTVTTFAGMAGINTSLDGTGTAATFNIPNGSATDGTALSMWATIFILHSAARFKAPRGITTDGHVLFISDSSNHTIRVMR